MFVVTGGGRGIGRALALALAARGQSVLIVGRHEETLRAVSTGSTGIDYCVADVALEDGRQRIVARLADQSTIRGLIHNAGTIDPIQRMAHIDLASWRGVMMTNVEAPLFLTQAFYEKLASGRVLNISSGAAHFPVQGWSAYCVSKAALSMMTRCWQLESMAPVFASVMPGIVDTDMVAQIRNSDRMDQAKHDFFQRLKEQQRLLSPETVALFLTWLLLDVESSVYTSKEWDIYDQSHHDAWLPSTHLVPSIDLI